MNTQYFPLEAFDSIKRLFAERMPHYTVSFTTHSIGFKPLESHKDRVLLSDRILSFKALGMMGSLKKEVRERLPDLKIEYGDTQYYSFKKQIEQGNCSEYDLEHAYLSALYEMGGISDTLYEKLQQVKKDDRLAVVGSLATNKLTVEYRYAEQVGPGTRHRDKELFKVWKTICFRVDCKMRKWFLNDQTSLFYWVDALFTKSETKLPGTKERKVRIGTHENFIYFDDGRRFPILAARPYVEGSTFKATA